MPNINLYGDISPRTAAVASKMLLERAIPYLCLEKFGDGKPVDRRTSKAVTFRRYESLAHDPKYLVEGVTPDGSPMTFTDVTATLRQMGDRIGLSDVVIDTHEDPALEEAMDLLGEQAGRMIESARWGVVSATSSVEYANGVSDSDVNTTFDLQMHRRMLRAIKRQNGTPFTKIVRSTPSYGHVGIAPSFIGLTHPDVENVIRDIPGYKDPIDYGSVSPWENEIGALPGVRFVSSTIFEPLADAGGAAGSMLSTSGTNADVYPILYVARHSYGIVPLKGRAAATPMVVNPRPSDSDPMAQRAHASWKAMQTAVILNDLWMSCGRVAIPA